MMKKNVYLSYIVKFPLLEYVLVSKAMGEL